MSKLYELNKDMLVQLVETIEKDLKKELNDCKKDLHFYKDRFELCESLGNAIYACFQEEKGCPAIRTSNDYGNQYKYCEKIVTCRTCCSDFCDSHGNITTRICMNCFK